MKTKKEYLKCILTEEDKRQRAEKMALCISQINEQEAQLKSAQTQIKSKIAVYEGELAISSEQYRSGFEMRYVDCEIYQDYYHARVSIIRMDTGEIIEERAMTAEERQQNLPLEAQDGNKTP